MKEPETSSDLRSAKESPGDHLTPEELKVLTKVGKDPERLASGKARPEPTVMPALQAKPREDSTTTTATTTSTSSREDLTRDSRRVACNRDRDQRTEFVQNLSRTRDNR